MDFSLYFRLIKTMLCRDASDEEKTFTLNQTWYHAEDEHMIKRFIIAYKLQQCFS